KIKEQYETEYKNSREVLWETLQNKYILNGLINYGDNLNRKIKDYIKKPASEHNSKIKKLDNTVTKLITRAMLKPSPFSTFCKVKMNLADYTGETTNQEAKSNIQINYVHILRLWDLLTKNEEVIKRLHFYVNYSMKKQGDYYILSKLIDKAEENGKVFEGKTTLVKIPTSNLLDELDILRVKRQDYPYVTIDQLINKVGQGMTVKYLLEKKILLTRERPAEMTFRPIEDFIDNLENWGLLDIEIVSQTVENLNLLKKYLKDLEDITDWCERHNKYLQVKETLDGIYKSLNQEKWCDSNIIYEDYIQEEIEEGKEIIPEDTKRVLEILTSINLLFDVNVRTQNKFAERFKNKYGEELVHTSDGTLISQIIDANSQYNHYWDNNIAKDTLDDIEINSALNQLKNEVIAYMESLLKKNKKEVHIDLEYLEDIANRLPEEIKRRKRSFDYFLQKTGDGFVLNNVYSGYLMYFSRFLQYYPQLEASESYKNYINKMFNENEKVCDIRIASGFNGNMRPQIAGNDLSLPMQMDEENKNKVDYRSCYYFYDSREKRVKLYNERVGRFTVISQGSLMPLYLPGITGLLHSMFVNSLAFQNINKMDAAAEYFPRIYIGNIVISRQTWRVSKEEIESLNLTGSDDCEEFCRLNDWVKEKGIPSKVFIKKDVQKEMADIFLGRTDNSDLDMTKRKPQYIDFYNPVLVQLFVKMCKDGYDLIIEEAYPDYTKTDCNVREHIVEISCVGEGLEDESC
ncbi:MAG: lantibiotic dehydratase, partial [Pseudobutyrivibrio sp.]|nr:lantibiotic dehydratase [Pseudobutyrivibrio sp.]